MKRSKLLLLGATLAAGLLTTQVVALPLAPAQAFMTGVESSTSTSSTQAAKTHDVNCDQGQFAYGGGGSINGGGVGNVSLQGALPIGNPPTGFRVRAAALSSGIGSWSVTAWALCGTFTTNLHVEVGSVGPSTARSKEVDAECPTSQRMYGTGFDMSPTTNGTVLVHDIIPGTTLTPRSVTVRATARPGLSPSWSMDAFAICANGAAGMRIDAASSMSTSNPTRDTSKTCENASHFAQGLGVQTFGATDAVDGRIALRAIRPPNNRSVRGVAEENGTAVGETWQLRVYVICSI